MSNLRDILEDILVDHGGACLDEEEERDRVLADLCSAVEPPVPDVVPVGFSLTVGEYILKTSTALITLNPRSGKTVAYTLTGSETGTLIPCSDTADMLAAAVSWYKKEVAQ